MRIVYKRKHCLSVLVFIFFSAVLVYGVSTGDPNIFREENCLKKLLEQNHKAAIALAIFCNSNTFGVVHTEGFYKNAGNGITESQSKELLKIRDISDGLSSIILKGVEEKSDPNECIDIIKQLILLESKLYSPKSIGAGNVAVANNISLSISGLTFHLLSNTKDLDDKKLNFLILPRYPKANDSVDQIADIVERESMPLTTSRQQKMIPFIAGCVKEQYGNLIQDNSWNFTNDMSACDIVQLNSFFKKPDRSKSINPTVSFDSLSFFSNYIIAIRSSFYSRMALPYIRIRKAFRSRNDITAEFEKYLLLNMTEIENDILTDSEKSFTDVCSETEEIINTHLESQGRSFLRHTYRRTTIISNE